MFCFVLFWFGFVCLFLRRVFIVFRGWECEFRHFLSPLIWSSDFRLIHCEIVKPGLTLHSTSKRALCALITVPPVQRKCCILLQETSKFLLNVEWSRSEAAQWQRSESSLSTWLDSGGEHRHVISQSFHFQGDSICGYVIIVNLHPWGFMTKIITELHGQKRGSKGVCQGPEQIGKHRSSLWLSHSAVSDCWRLLSW